MKKKLVVAALTLAMTLGGISAMAADDQLYISVISKGEQHAFWQAVRKGCEAAADDYDVEMFYYGPPSESDIALQVEALNTEIQKSPDAIALAALSTESVMAQIQECLDGEIPIIGFDSGVPNAPDGAIYATASTDNQNAAALAAEKMMEEESFVELVKNATAEAPVVIGVLSQDATGESNVNRTTGFVNRMVELVSEYNEVSVTGHELWKAEKENAPVVINVEIPATPEVTDITNAASALLNTKGISAIFCSNEGTVSGLLAATSSGADLADGAAYGDLLVAGFDAGAPQKNAVRNGWFIGSVTQDPYRIGYLSIELAVKAAKGEEVEDVDTGAQWYTAENIDDPDIAMLVYD